MDVAPPTWRSCIAEASRDQTLKLAPSGPREAPSGNGLPGLGQQGGEKLEYVDEVMRELAGKPPAVKLKSEVEPVQKLRQTLREYYREKQERYGESYPDFYDQDLGRLFPEPMNHRKYPPASSLLRRISPELRRRVSAWTGEYAYPINRVLRNMIQRSRELRKPAIAVS